MKKILITGGSDGIGLATARLLAAQGAALTLVARNPQKLQAALAILPGPGHTSLAADLSTPDGVDLVARHLDANRYDVFVNNAGSGLYGRFEAIPLAEQLGIMHLNMDALTVLAHHYLAQARPGDALVNTASTLAFTGMPGSAVYAATKAYAANLSESLWWEFKDKGVFVLGFNPGATASSFHTAAGGSKDTFSASVMQTPEAVAKELVAALTRRRSPRAVSGASNRLMLFIMKWLPRKVSVNLIGGFSPLKKA